MIRSQKANLSKIVSAFEERNDKEFAFCLENFAINSNVSLSGIGIDATIIEYVLQSPNSSDFIKICLQYGEDFYKKNDRGFHLLYYAVQSLCVENLDTILKYFKSSSTQNLTHQINQETDLKSGNNYLHKVIEQLTGANYNECKKIISKLLQYGCNPNHLNENSKSPLELLLDKSNSTLEVKELIELFVENGKFRIEIADKEEYREKVMEMNIGHRINVRKNHSIDIEYLSQQIAQGNEEEFVNLLRKIDQQQVLLKIQELIMTSIEMNFVYGVKELLTYVQKEKFGMHINHTTALFYAVSLCRPQIVKEFLKLDHIKFHNGSKQKNILHEICSLNHIENDKEFMTCFEIIVKDKRCSNDIINAFDNNNKTPLMHACENGHKEVEFELLRRGAYIGHESVVSGLNEQTLAEYLDECITPTTDLNDPNCTVQINYKFLIPPKNTGAGNLETTALNLIASHSKFGTLMTHPVFTTFLELKWKRVNFFIYLTLLFYFLFFLYLSLFVHIFFNNPIFNKRIAKHEFDHDYSDYLDYDVDSSGDGSGLREDGLISFSTTMTAIILNELDINDGSGDELILPPEIEASTTSKNRLKEPPSSNVLSILLRGKRDFSDYREYIKYHNTKRQLFIEYKYLYLFTLFGTLILTISELIQIMFSWKSYFLKFSNWIDWILLLLAYTVLLDFIDRDPVALRQVRAVLFLVIAMQSFILIAMVSKLSLQLEIFKKVCKTFIKFIMLYFILIFAFAMAFKTLFGHSEDDYDDHDHDDEKTDSNDAFNGILFSIITVIRMMLSDFGAVNLKSDDDFNAIIFLSFVLLITIILFNLLNALAINDTQDIMKSAEIVDVRKRIKLIGSCERILSLLRINYFNIYSNLIHNGRIVLMVNKDNFVRIRNYSFDDIGESKSSKHPTKISIVMHKNDDVKKYSEVDIPRLIPIFRKSKLNFGPESMEKIIKHVKQSVVDS